WAGEGGRVWTWDAAGGRLLGARRGDSSGAIARAVLSRDAALLATADRARGVVLWDLPNGHRTIAPRELAYFVAISPDGKSIAACGPDEAVTTWGPPSGRNARAPAGSVSRLGFSPAGPGIASAPRGVASSPPSVHPS